MEVRAVVRTLGMAVAALVLSGAACGRGAPADLASPGVEEIAPEEIAPDPPAAPVRPLDPVVGDVIPAGAGSVAVLDAERFGSAGRLFNPPAGREYYAAEVKACSGPEEKGLTFAPDFFLLEMADKTMVDPGLPIKRPSLQAGKVPAGGCVAGWVTFTIPEEAVPASVLYDGSERLKWRIPPPASKPS
ncbi:MAG: DUF4352 domain-containing protein [Acidimicrobiia bacterium]